MPSFATLLSALALPLLVSAAPAKDHIKCPKGLVSANGATFQQNGKNEYFAGTNVSRVPSFPLRLAISDSLQMFAGLLARPAPATKRARHRPQVDGRLWRQGRAYLGILGCQQHREPRPELGLLHCLEWQQVYAQRGSQRFEPSRCRCQDR